MQACHRLIDHQQPVEIDLNWIAYVVQIHSCAPAAAAALVCSGSASVVNQDLPHRCCRCPKKRRTVLQCHLTALCHLQHCFMNQRCCVQHVARALAEHSDVSD